MKEDFLLLNINIMEIQEYVKIKKEEIKKEIELLNKEISFLIIQVNDDLASNAYVKGKIKDATEVGIKAILKKLPTSTSQTELLAEIDKANNDDSICGIIVQMPLPKHISEEVISLAISPRKDIDGFHPMSKFIPCTPKGIIDYLKFEKFEFDSKNALVIGRSNIVGKPMAKLLLNENCNVIITHSHTKKDDLKMFIKEADLIVIAIGKTYFLDDSYTYKKDAVIVDVGINRTSEGLKGDCKPNLGVKLQTPVPKGVGLLTRLSLLTNILEAFKNEF